MKLIKTRPIIFSSEMVRAILDGSKTQTRRVIKPQPKYYKHGDWFEWGDKGDATYLACNMPNHCPYGRAPDKLGLDGDSLWVRETFALNDKGQVLTKTTKDSLTNLLELPDIPIKWTPAIFMPRWASRLTLEITEIRVERLQEITAEDIRKEGIAVPWRNEYAPLSATVPRCSLPWERKHREEFTKLWDSLNAKRGYPFESNPFVWVISFRQAADSSPAAPAG